MFNRWEDLGHYLNDELEKCFSVRLKEEEKSKALTVFYFNSWFKK